MMRKFWVPIALFLILSISFFLRFYKITTVPPSLNWDEVSIGYNAYSILKTGKDEWGVRFPLHFKSYGEYKLPAQIYASIPGIYLFGLNELGLRITPVVYGTLTILLVYFLAKRLSGSDFVGLVSAFLLGISPWHIQLTRASFESSFSVFWVVLGILLLVKGFEKPKYWIFSIIPFVIAVYTYNSARVFVPLFGVAIFFLYRGEFLKFKKYTIISAALFFLLLTPLIPFVLNGEATARYKLVSITDEAGLVPRINERRGNSSFPPVLARLVHNKVTYISFYFARNYLAHLDPNFLFLNGAGHRQHHVQDVGELYLFQAPFLVVGLYLLFKKKNKFRYLIIAWVALAFVPVATTQDSIPNALRTIIAAPALQILTAIGLYEIYILLRDDKNTRYLFVASIGLVLIFSFCKYMTNLFKNYPNLYSQDWQYGNKEAVEFIKENYTKYDLIVFTRHYGEPHMFTLFYFPWNPADFQSNPTLVRFETYDWVRVLKFDKFYFPDLGDTGTRYDDVVKENPGKKILFIGKSGDFPPGVKKLKEINFLNGKNAFEIVEN